MKTVLTAFVILGSALVQVTWASRLEVAGAFPNLVLLAVVAITWTQDVRAAFLWACAGGLLLDLASEGAIGPHALALLVGVYLIGFWARNTGAVTALHAGLSAAVATVIYSAVLLSAAGALHATVPPLDVAAELCLAATVYNALLAPFAVALARKLSSLLPSAPDPA